MGGFNASGAVFVSHPAVINPLNPLKGVQVGLNGQIAAMWGFGMFLGVADQLGIGVSKGPVKSGPGTNGYAEVDFGDEAAAGGSITGNRTSLSGGIGGKKGIGAGFFIGGGVAKSYTLATRPAFCQ